MELIEEWRDVVGFPGYEVSNLGRLRSTMVSAEPRVLRPTPDRDGYTGFTLSRAGIHFKAKTHRLVLSAFYGPSDSPVNHIDGNKANNDLRNLEWSSPAANSLHAVRHGLIKRGAASRKAKLTQAHADEIRERYKRGGITMRELGAESGVSQMTISRLVRCMTYEDSHADV